jgi:hypothetical protein
MLPAINAMVQAMTAREVWTLGDGAETIGNFLAVLAGDDEKLLFRRRSAFFAGHYVVSGVPVIVSIMASSMESPRTFSQSSSAADAFRPGFPQSLQVPINGIPGPFGDVRST